MYRGERGKKGRERSLYTLTQHTLTHTDIHKPGSAGSMNEPQTFVDPSLAIQEDLKEDFLVKLPFQTRRVKGAEAAVY